MFKTVFLYKITFWICVSAVNSQRLLCSQKASVKCSFWRFLSKLNKTDKWVSLEAISNLLSLKKMLLIFNFLQPYFSKRIVFIHLIFIYFFLIFSTLGWFKYEQLKWYFRKFIYNSTFKIEVYENYYISLY